MFCPRCHRTPENPVLPFCRHDGETLTHTPRIQNIPSEPAPETGEIIDDRYIILGLLGKGSMARVYLAEDTTTGEPVAVKILNHDMAKSRALRERFLREVDVARKLEHPTIARILGAGERKDRSPYLVIEFLFGESLGDHLRRAGPVRPAAMLPLLRDAASALAAAHKADIIHRDIKPDNLFLVGERGVPYALKILDFALAKLHEGNLTGIGMAVGTLAYMAPEQAITDKVDARTDVYGLGVVMYRMFVGRLPFTVADRVRLIGAHLFVTPPRPTDLVPTIDPRLEQIILTALRKHPDNRYPSMDDLALDIERLMDQRPGSLSAGPLRREPDNYEPQTSFAQTAAMNLYTRLHDEGSLDGMQTSPPKPPSP